VAVWRNGDIVGHINKVVHRQARLVLGWVIVPANLTCRRDKTQTKDDDDSTFGAGKVILICNCVTTLPGQLSLAIPCRLDQLS